MIGEFEIKTLQNAPRDADELRQLLGIIKDKRKKLCTLKIHKGKSQRLKCYSCGTIFGMQKAEISQQTQLTRGVLMVLFSFVPYL